ncbi:hypothetical protein M406DRAFT_354049 [Cryphonectria parasitica EP155]|uniref:Uncharacterized protein n=1 Tax=Cryphonectria parasitica (strain ATCC 38755 / EP155) TaxID=660469 RepID=A0A9P4YAN8_CRYP1|nr:uncharacterized protein M406DRAFT_354049 [Cryphonectria parasitica EP155]KAF3769553.1 hypothetical protein M406DRAFT_354049 [Cryphonectria parasitica EP155]
MSLCTTLQPEEQESLESSVGISSPELKHQASFPLSHENAERVDPYAQHHLQEGRAGCFKAAEDSKDSQNKTVNIAGSKAG